MHFPKRSILLNKTRKNFSTIALVFLFSLCGCATMIEGSKQKIMLHCEPNDNIKIISDGKEIDHDGGLIFLDKKRKMHYVTVEKEGYNSSTMALYSAVNPLWPTADLLWVFGFPIAWFIDWQTGAWNTITPDNIHVILRIKE